MFTMRSLAIFALIATAVALPVQEKPIPKAITTITDEEFVPSAPAPWFNVPFFGDISKLFSPLWKLFPSFEDLGPRILADDDKFQVIVQVKDYKKEDLKVKVKGDFIFVQGSHEAKQEDHDLFASQFFHTYTLPANASAVDVTAALSSDGYLIVNAPIGGSIEKQKESDIEVPIVETGKPYKESNPAVPDASSPASVSSPVPEITTLSEADDRREPTTVADREEVTEKDNVIPHGNEVTP